MATNNRIAITLNPLELSRLDAWRKPYAIPRSKAVALIVGEALVLKEIEQNGKEERTAKTDKRR